MVNWGVVKNVRQLRKANFMAPWTIYDWSIIVYRRSTLLLGAMTIFPLRSVGRDRADRYPWSDMGPLIDGLING